MGDWKDTWPVKYLMLAIWKVLWETLGCNLWINRLLSRSWSSTTGAMGVGYVQVDSKCSWQVSIYYTVCGKTDRVIPAVGSKKNCRFTLELLIVNRILEKAVKRFICNLFSLSIVFWYNENAVYLWKWSKSYRLSGYDWYWKLWLKPILTIRLTSRCA